MAELRAPAIFIHVPGFHANLLRLPMRFIPVFSGLLATSACSGIPSGYNTSGSRGILAKQEASFNSIVSHYDNGLTIYTLGTYPPPAARNSVYTR